MGQRRAAELGAHRLFAMQAECLLSPTRIALYCSSFFTNNIYVPFSCPFLREELPLLNFESSLCKCATGVLCSWRTFWLQSWTYWFWRATGYWWWIRSNANNRPDEGGAMRTHWECPRNQVLLFANANKHSTKWRRCDDLSLHHLIHLQHQNTQLCSPRESLCKQWLMEH